MDNQTQQITKTRPLGIGELNEDEQKLVPPSRRHPSRNSVKTYFDNRAIMLYVTVVTEKRKPILANAMPHDCIVEAWRAANGWDVGRYVIMPDHVHFFCAPATYPTPDFHKWMKYWKTIAAKMFWALKADAGSPFCSTGNHAKTGEQKLISLQRDASIKHVNPPLFQRDCWDRQLRTGDSYAQKWEYVRNNPVRKGLVGHAEDWPFQGEMNVLEWHEKV